MKPDHEQEPDHEQARVAAVGMQIGMHLVVQVAKVDLTDSQKDELQSLLIGVATGDETLVATVAEMQRVYNPRIDESTRKKIDELNRRVARMILWFHSNAKL